MRTAVVIPNWNGADLLRPCLDALLDQSQSAQVFVVDNGSTDGSAQVLDEYGDRISVIRQTRNLGFSGGVNAGIREALRQGYEGIALLNNDAVPDRDWISSLIESMRRTGAGIVTSLILLPDGVTVDTSGDEFTTWGLAGPRGRGRIWDDSRGAADELVFGACAGASLYDARLFDQIGLFDEDFFAYYEDVDLSFRAQLAGWHIAFTPSARVRHLRGATSSRVRGFSTYHTYKNLPLILHKNVPREMAPAMYTRFYFAYLLYLLRTVLTRDGVAALRGAIRSVALTPRKLRERRHIMRTRVATVPYLRSLLSDDLPDGYVVLRRVRRRIHQRRGRSPQ